MNASGEEAPASAIDRNAVLAFAIPFLLLVPFSSKPFHIDDTHFLRMAEHIQNAPLDYFGYVIHWNGYVGPGFDTNYNPPGIGYVLALAAAVFGWNEVPLHLLFAIFAGLTSLGVYRLARQWSAPPLIAAAAMALAPGFIVSGSTLMSDVPALGLYVWAIHCWAIGIEKNEQRWLAGGAVLMGLSALTKYFGITAVGLAFVYALLHRRKLGAWCLYLTIPLAMLLLYSMHTQAMYGRNHLLFSQDFARTVRAYLDESLLERILTVIPYFGGMTLPWLVLLTLHPSRSRRFYIFAALAGCGIGAVVGLYPPAQAFYGYEDSGVVLYTALVGAGAVLGAAVLAWAMADVSTQRRPADVVLTLWLLGTLVYGVAVAPVLGGRVLLPALPAAAMLFSRRLTPRSDVSTSLNRRLQMVSWAAAALLTLAVLAADYVAADRDRQAAMHAVRIAEASDAQLSYYGTWGFQYYAEQSGAKPFVAVEGEDGLRRYPLTERGLVVVPQMYGAITIPEEFAEVAAQYSIEEAWPVATWDARSRAGFYGEFLGRMPFAFDGPRRHDFVVYKTRTPNGQAPD